MKKILKKIYSATKNLVDTIVSLISVILFSSLRADRHFKHQRIIKSGDEECHILCNGPSLSDVINKGGIDFKNAFVVNYFATTEQYRIIKPNNYIILDNIEIGRDKTITNEQKRMVYNLYETIVNETQWPLTFYYPSNGVKEYIDILKRNKNITVVIYNMTPVSGLKCISRWLYRHSLGMPLPQNISNAAVFCALNAG